MFTGDYAAAEPLMQEGLRLSRAAADLPMVAHTLSVLSNLIWLRREFAAARDLAEEGVEASQRAGDRREEALNLWVLAQATHDLGDDDDACRLAEAALAISSEIDFAPAAALALTTLGQLQFRRAELVPARRLLERSLQENRAANRPLAWQWALGNLGWVVLEQGDFGEARALFLDALAIGRDVLGGRARLAIPLEGLAQVAAATGDPERAYLLAGAAWTLRETYATPPAPTEQWQLERSLQRARAAMGERAAADAWASGRALNAEQAIAEALATPATATSQSGVAGHASDALTPREREVAALIGQGLSTHELAEHLVIAEATARVHIEHILAKLGLHSRTQLAIWAFTTRG